ncbi:hypothetical protein [Bacillus sp. FJAT-27445]|uniref:hypothetical protein n=1 Tax=Bacillus sp. FJAT-27445 TaxID=1679166 RepID=UPI0007440060|nr:hypothetical protein [Bacillus sp. FJAT-27445]
MNRFYKHLILTIFIIFVGFFAYKYFSIKQTTYGDVVSELLKNDETVKRIDIAISTYNEGTVTRKTAIISNNDIINRLLNEPAKMELMTHDRLPIIEYWLTFYTDTAKKKGFDIIMGDGFAIIGKEQYRISGDNKLAETIENLDIDWEPK